MLLEVVASWWTMVAMPSPRSNSMTPLVFLGAPKRIVKPLPEPLDPTKVSRGRLLNLLRGYCKHHPMKGGHLGKQKEVKSTTRLWTPCGYHLPIMSWSNPGISVSNNDQSMLDQSQATISKDRARARRRSKLGSWPRNTLHLLQTPWGTGWWFEPLWKILVSWDYYSQYMGKNVPNHQPVGEVMTYCWEPRTYCEQPPNKRDIDQQ